MKILLFFIAVLMLPSISSADNDAIEGFMVVDCLLPGQVRRLGSMTYSAARKAVKTTASDCEIRGGEYIAYDRATRKSALEVWKPLAEKGDLKAQHYCGEIYEKGMGEKPDYVQAASWYLKAAERGYAPSAMNLGNLFEQGLGVEKDLGVARFWYQQATGINGLSFPQADSVSSISASHKDDTHNILIVEPPLKKLAGRFVLKDKARSNAFPVVGQIKSDKPVKKVTVGMHQADVIANSLFRTTITPGTDDSIDVVVQFADGKTESLRIFLNDKGLAKPEKSSVSKSVPVALNNTTRISSLKGNQYALIIGNNQYDYLSNLETAINDAAAVAKVLENDYGFKVTVINNANRYNALSAINELRTNFREDDRLLVYYAGHGELDSVNKRGHWLPVDAEHNSMANWISTITITDLLNTIPARQMIVIADSCYSGMMTRSALGVIDQQVDEKQRRQLLKALAGTRTRTALTSGGVAPVLDGGGDGHSVFARSLLDVLNRNKGVITGYELFKAVSHLVQKRAGQFGFEQQPDYAPLKFAGHEAGDFVFIKR